LLVVAGSYGLQLVVRLQLLASYSSFVASLDVALLLLLLGCGCVLAAMMAGDDGIVSLSSW